MKDAAFGPRRRWGRVDPATVRRTAREDGYLREWIPPVIALPPPGTTTRWAASSASHPARGRRLRLRRVATRRAILHAVSTSDHAADEPPAAFRVAGAGARARVGA